MTSQPPAPFLRMSPIWSTSRTKPWSVSAVSDWRNDFQRVKTPARVWTFLLPGHCIGIFFLEVLKIRPQGNQDAPALCAITSSYCPCGFFSAHQKQRTFNWVREWGERGGFSSFAWKPKFHFHSAVDPLAMGDCKKWHDLPASGFSGREVWKGLLVGLVLYSSY